MKIAVFSSRYEVELEKEINAWLKIKPGIKVISQSVGGAIRDDDGRHYIILTILYKEKARQRKAGKQ